MRSLLASCLLCVVLMLVSGKKYPVPIGQKSKDFWAASQTEAEAFMKRKPNTNRAKNVILFVGDGMGMTTTWASRVYIGQRKLDQSGEEYEMEFEKFPYVALAKTYNTDGQVPDSAGTSTAFLSGVKTNVGVVGVTPDVKRKNCSNQAANEITTIMDWSVAEGKSVGFVSTARVTHATNAAGYAMSAERNWESDTDFNLPYNQPPGQPDYNKQFNCKDIALQLVEDNPNITVVFGGGRQKFLPKSMSDPEYGATRGTTGGRSDGRNLPEEWLQSQRNLGRNSTYVWNKEQFDAVDASQTDSILGLFEPSHMQYEMDRDNMTEPSLAELTEKAIKMLRKNPNGFFIMIEAGRIDHAHHAGLAQKAMKDTWAMEDAVKIAKNLTDPSDTLLVVTADHSHAFTTAGYPSRGNDILGLVDIQVGTLDNMPYTTLVYGNGPGAVINRVREDLTTVDTTLKDYKQQAVVPLYSETHGGEDVPIYAEGPMAHLFHGVHDQTYIAYVMAYASCVGQDKRHCEMDSNPTTSNPTTSNPTTSNPESCDTDVGNFVKIDSKVIALFLGITLLQMKTLLM